MAKLLYIFLIPWYLLAYASQAQANADFPHDSTWEVFSQKGKKGIRSENGNILLDAKYQAFAWSAGIDKSNGALFGYQQNDLWGLMSLELEEISKPKYNSLLPFGDDFFIISEKSKYSKVLFYGLIKSNGRNKIKPKFRNIYPAGNHLIAAIKKEQTIFFGIMNSSGKAIVPFQYFHISYLGQNNYVLTKESGSKELVKLSPKPTTLLHNMDSVSKFRDGVAIIFKNGKQGLIRQDGKILLPIEYKKIEWNEGKHIYVTPLDQWTIFNRKGQVVKTHKADSVFHLNDSLIVKNTSSFAQIRNVITDENKEVFHADILDVFGDRYILKNSNHIYIAQDSNTNISERFGEEVRWNKDFFVAKKKDYQGYKNVIINTEGKTIEADSFYFSKEFIALETNENWGLYDKNLREIIPPLYDKITRNGDQFIVQFKSQFGVIDQENDWVIPPRYLMIESIDETYYKMVDDHLREYISNGTQKKEARLYYDFYGKYGVEQDLDNQFRLIDRKGNALSSFRTGIYNGHGKSGILFQNRNQHILLDSLGKELFAIANYDTILLSEDDYLTVQKNGQWGFINNQGILRIANRYDTVRAFQNDRSAFKIRNAWGFINRKEDIVIQPYYSEVSDFEHNTAFVRFNNKYGLIDHNGEFIIEAEYDEIIKVKGFFLIRKGSKWGITNSTGNVITYPTYDKILVQDGFLKVEKYGSTRILSEDGRNLINQQFDNIYYDSQRKVFLAKKSAEKEQVFLTDILTGKYP